MTAARHVKLFRNGRNQAVRIPREFEIAGQDAIMRKEGDRLIIEPRAPEGPNAALLALMKSLGPMDLPLPDDEPPEPAVWGG